LRRAGLSRGRQVELVVDAPGETVGTDIGVPLGLLVTEAITNAYKHAFVDRSSGRIVVEVRRESPERMYVRVRDNGVGYEPPAEHAESPGLGRSLIEAFARQMRGELKIYRQEGTVVEVLFAAAERKAPSATVPPASDSTPPAAQTSEVA